MGLDMYAYAVEHGSIDTSTDVDFEYEWNPKLEIQYWRKNHYLMGWMTKLYKAKGGTDSFNGNPVRLTEFDLDLLIKDIKEERLTPTSGFFYGNDFNYYSEQAKIDIEFASKAQNLIREGKDVFFNSSW